MSKQAYMMSTIDYFWVLKSWDFMALIVVIWFADHAVRPRRAPGAPLAGH